MERGTIVLTKFPFTDLSAAKRRPALVLSRVKDDKEDVIVAFISSVIPLAPSDTDFILDKSHPDDIDTGLIKKSVFKMDKLAALNKAIFSGEIGKVSDNLMKELEEKLIIALELKKST